MRDDAVTTSDSGMALFTTEGDEQCNILLHETHHTHTYVCVNYTV